MPIIRKFTYAFLSILTLFGFFSSVNAQNTFNETNKAVKANLRALGRDANVLVLKDEQIICNQSFGNYTSSTVLPIASCSKWLTAALVMTFIDEGKLSLDDPISRYLPEYKGKDKITISQCLSHTSGIKSDPINMRNLLARRKIASLKDEVIGFASLPMAAEPGKAFAYSNIGLNILGRIIEVIENNDFESIFQQRIAIPLEMTQTTFAKEDKAPNPSGGAMSTSANYMNFLQMLLQHGEYNGKRILSEKAINSMQRSSIHNLPVLYTPEQGEGVEYGFGEWIQEKDDNGNTLVVSSPGLFGTFPYIDLKRNYAAIVMVKNLRTENRKATYKAIKNAIDKDISR